MAGGRAIKAGEAFIELTVNNAALQRGLKAAQAHLKAFGAAVSRAGRWMMGLGGAVTGLGVAGVAAFTRLGDATAKAAKRTGLTVEALSELKFAASQSDVAAEDLTRGMLAMNRTLADAERGTTTAKSALAALGQSAEGLQALSPEKRFMALADALSRVEDPGRRAALAMMVFGRGGAKMLPMLAEGAAGIEALRAKARDLGLTMSTEDATAAERFSDAVDQVKQSLQMAFFRVGTAIAPILTDLAERFAVVLGRVSAFIDNNRGLVISVLKLGGAIMAGGATLFALGKAFSGLSGALGIVRGALPLLGTALSALMSPVGLVISAVVALGGVLLYVTGYGGKLLGWLGDRFEELKATATRVFGAIGKALAGGNLEAAAKVLWAALKLAWQSGVTALMEIWIGFKEAFLRVATNAWYGAAKVLAGAWGGLRSVWATTTTFLSKTWTRFVYGVLSIWNSVSGALRKAWAKLRSWFDSDYDYEAAKRTIEAEMQIEAGALDQQRAKELANAERAYNEQMAAIGQEYEDTVAQLDKDAAAAHARRQQKYAERIKAAKDELVAARKELDAAMAEAEATPAVAAGEKAPPRAAAATARLGGLTGALTAAAAALEVRGTFSAMAAFGLGAGSATERIANATEETAKNTGRILDELKDGGVTFE